eukprot:403372435
MNNNKEILDRSTKKFLMEDMQEQQDKMLEERDINLVLLTQDYRDSLPRTLCSKLDRIQKFINQLKSAQDSKRLMLIEECQELNLKRHTSEVVASITSSKMTIKDQDTIIEICVLMHHRYEEFAQKLIDALERQFFQEKMSEFNKKRNILRLLSELYLKGLFSEFKRLFKGISYLTQITPDKEEFQSALMVLTDYLRNYGEMFFHQLSKQRREAIDNDYEVTIERPDFLNKQQREKIHQFFKDYLNQKCLEEINNRYKLLKDAKRRFEDNLKEVKQDEKIENSYMTIRNEFEKMHNIVEEFADTIDSPIPEFIIEEDKSLQTKMILKKKQKVDASDEFFPFEDELTHNFYRNFPDLSRFIQSEKETTGLSQLSMTSSEADLDEMHKKLQKSQTKDQIDEKAQDFIKQNPCVQFKSGRKEMAKILFNIPRNSLSLLPYYARFTAIIHYYFKDMGNDLIKMLEHEFNELYEQNDVIKIETKIRNIRFLGELTKFQVCPPQTILECLKKCLDDFHGHNVEIITNLLETCGKYLSKLEETQLKFNNLIEFLQRLKEKENISSKQLANLESALLQCRGPVGIKVHPKKQELLTNIQFYIKHLFLERISKKTLDEVFVLILKLPWHDEEEFISRMDTIAILLASLKQYYRPFVVKVIDSIFEEILRQCERNDFKESQRRVAMMKFIGECYNFKVLHTQVLFDLLYKLMNYDNLTQQEDEIMKSLDSPQESFRIRLICTTLDSLGRFFQRGERRRIMDRFLMFFQRYIYSKNYVLMDLEFMILDTFDSVRPKFIRFESQEEAISVCKKIEDYEERGVDIIDIIKAYHEDTEHEQYMNDYYEEYYDEDYGDEQQDDEENFNDDNQNQAEKDDLDDKIKEQIKEQRQQMLNEQEKMEMQAFEADFNQLIQESAQVARKEIGNILTQQRKEILIPFAQIKSKLANSQTQQHSNASTNLTSTNSSTSYNDSKNNSAGQKQPINLNSMAFALVTKKGNKTNVKQIDVPLNSYIAVKTKERILAEEEEREKVKEQILKITAQDQDKLSQEDEDDDLDHNEDYDEEIN